MAKSAFDHRFGTWLAVLLQEAALERAGVDADAHRAAVVLGGGDHLAYAALRPDVAGVDAQARGARLGRLDRPFVVEVDVGDYRHLGGTNDLMQGLARVLVGT